MPDLSIPQDGLNMRPIATASPSVQPEKIKIPGQFGQRTIEFTAQANPSRLKTLEVGHLYEDGGFRVTSEPTAEDYIFQESHPDGKGGTVQRPTLSLRVDWDHSTVYIEKKSYPPTEPGPNSNGDNFEIITFDPDGKIITTPMDETPIIVCKLLQKPSDQTQGSAIVRDQSGNFYLIRVNSRNSPYADKEGFARHTSVEATNVRINGPKIVT